MIGIVGSCVRLACPRTERDGPWTSVRDTGRRCPPSTRARRGELIIRAKRNKTRPSESPLRTCTLSPCWDGPWLSVPCSGDGHRDSSWNYTPARQRCGLPRQAQGSRSAWPKAVDMCVTLADVSAPFFWGCQPLSARILALVLRLASPLAPPTRPAENHLSARTGSAGFTSRRHVSHGPSSPRGGRF